MRRSKTLTPFTYLAGFGTCAIPKRATPPAPITFIGGRLWDFCSARSSGPVAMAVGCSEIVTDRDRRQCRTISQDNATRGRDANRGFLLKLRDHARRCLDRQTK
jgi:hypothetical protein